jgi:hypothetical protein
MSLRVLPSYVAIALIFGTASASAQPTAYPPGLQPVSPGHFTSATPAAACPGFSWAAKPGAIGYELAVHKVTRQTQLDPVPVLNAMLPGTAAAWTPSIDQCLETGSEYMWFIREVGEVGEPIGGWSEGMRFRVAAAGGTASNRREATNDAADQPPGGGVCSASARFRIPPSMCHAPNVCSTKGITASVAGARRGSEPP